MKDYIRFMLTGNPAQESTNHANTGFRNLREPGNDSVLFEIQGIEEYRRLIPPIIEPSEIAGYITKEASVLTGLAAGTPVVAGCYDICTSGLACGLTDETQVAIVVGTWGNNMFLSKEPLANNDILVTCNYPKEGYWLMCDGSPTSASNLEWFVREFLREEGKIADGNKVSVYDVCNESVGRTSPFDAGIVFLPLLYGGYGTGASKAAFLNIEGWHTRELMIRAIYEGICFSHKKHFSSVMRYHKHAPRAVRICGGGTRSNELMQIFADVLQLPMEIISTSEPGALGSCICAAVGIGAFENFDDAVGSLVRVKKVVAPNPSMKDIYEKKYNAFITALDSLREY
jgi:L-xylulokinase